MLLKEEQHEMFFEYIRKRQSIWYNRFILKKPREEWTDDEILKKYRFCNVFRELDRGTQNVLKNVIDNDELDFKAKFLNIVSYRFFNTHWYFDDIGVFKEYDKEDLKLKVVESTRRRGKTFGDAYLICAHTVDPRQRGKYIQISEAVEWVNQNFLTMYDLIKDETDPERMLKKIRIIPLVGQFLAYQILMDLIYTGELKLDANSRILIGIGAVKCLSYFTGKQRVHHNKTFCDELYEFQEKYVDLWKDIYPPKEMLRTPNSDKFEISWNNIQVNLSELGRYIRIKNNMRGKRKRYR